MALDDISGKIDPEKLPSLLLHLLMTSVTEHKALKSLFVHYLAQGNNDVQLQLLKDFNKRLELEHEKLKDRIFEVYGELPPELLSLL